MGLLVIHPEYKAVTKPFSRDISYLKPGKAKNRHCDSYDSSTNRSQQKNARFPLKIDIYCNHQLLQEITHIAHSHSKQLQLLAPLTIPKHGAKYLLSMLPCGSTLRNKDYSW